MNTETLSAEIQALKTRAHTQDIEIQRLSNELMGKDVEIARLKSAIKSVIDKMDASDAMHRLQYLQYELEESLTQP